MELSVPVPDLSGVTASDEEAALLRACLVAEVDDAPRLVYADWLDERGHAGAATILRQGCREPGADPTPQAIEGAWDYWADRFPDDVRPWVAFDRGLPTVLRCPIDWLTENTARWAGPGPWPLFRTLDLAHVEPTDEWWAALVDSPVAPGLTAIPFNN